MLAPSLSAFAPSAHRIQRGGLGFARALTDDEIRRVAPSAFAVAPHASRSERYAFVPTGDIIAGLRTAGFLPVKAEQARARTEDKREFTKHVIRLRRHDQLQAEEAREVILKNSHDGASAYQLSAGLFRLICANGLIVGSEDTTFKVQHKGRIIDDVIENACRVVDTFDTVTEQIELMKGATLPEPLRLAFAAAAIEARFDKAPELAPVKPEQMLRARRHEDMKDDAWTVLNRIQENVIRGGMQGQTRDANNRLQRRQVRAVNGIDQNDTLNRALWRLGVEVAKLAK